ncbi:putative helicase MAGATAMA 3 [Symbiodinium microadriaticum]|uniref:Putative helicase MAGATAMA 3 n=1 Tax=Symbiodinium microadriaticum TaxID=2951 RepID=A0A1Q9DRZ7_SYMMI|nr:putative helicase MAGATAMA 3 [Symbiodinium microadriaticum]
MGPNAHPDLKEDFSMNALVHKRLQAGCDMPDFQKKESEKIRLLKSSRLICSTLSISGHRDMVNFPEDFDTVVIDEASQGVEVSTLVPLKLGCRRLILVGDPEQLPATCFSEIAKEHKYDRSLFQRLQQTQYKVNMLNTQYRMHPDISQFPSVNFYDGNLLNFRDKEAFEAEYPTSWSHIPCLAPVAFFNLAGTMREESKSYVNEDEAQFIHDFFVCLRKAFPKEDWRRKLAVISPYAQQVNLIRHKFRELYHISSDKEPCPVDARLRPRPPAERPVRCERRSVCWEPLLLVERPAQDCIMVSLVRGAQLKSKTVGFLRDRRRMNVAFTRARLNLWVVGAAKVLSFNEDWKEFIDLLAGKCRLLRVTEPREDFLLRYLKRWHERNPKDDSTDGAALEAQSEESDCLLEAKDVFKLSPAEMDELRAEEAERLRYERDVEEVDEDDGIDPQEMAQSGVKRKADDAFGADFQQEEAPTRKEQNDDAEPEEEVAEG